MRTAQGETWVGRWAKNSERVFAPPTPRATPQTACQDNRKQEESPCAPFH